MEEEQFIELFPVTPNQELAEQMGVSTHTVIRRARALGLHKDKRYLQSLGRKSRSRMPTLKGEQHPNWKGGNPWKRFKDTQYRAWRNAVLERDNYICQDCGRQCKKHEKGLAAHHIQSYAQFPDLRYEINNGRTLCRQCHMKLHGKEYEVEMIPCACGCGTMIESKDPHGRRPRRFVNHHAPKVIYKDNPRPSRVRNAGDTLIPCACGCGTMITPYGAGGKPRRYLYEHINRGRKMPEATRQKLIEAKTVKRDMTPIPCACGCSTMIAPFDTDGKPRKYVHGHFHRGRKRSEATRQKIIAARTIQRDMTPIPCACGCGTMIAPFDTDGRPCRYVNHHGQRKKKS